MFHTDKERSGEYMSCRESSYGLGLVRKLRHKYSRDDKAVIVVSGAEDDFFNVSYLKSGANAIFEKAVS